MSKKNNKRLSHKKLRCLSTKADEQPDKNKQLKTSIRKYIFLLLILTIGVYFITLFNDFTYDDGLTIANNQFIRNMANIPDLFSKKYFYLSGESTYRPVVTLTYFIDYAIWKLEPMGYHLTNLIIHLTNVVLVYFFCMSLLGDNTQSFLSALFFSVHPVLTEAVNAISFREDLLTALFLLSSFILFIKILSPIPKKRSKYLILYVSSLLLYISALLSKEMSITFPLLLILFILCFNHEKGIKKQKLFPLLSGYIVITIGYLLIYFVFNKNPGPPPDSFYIKLSVRLLNIPHVLIRYFILLLFPFTLNVEYVVEIFQSWADPYVLLSIIILSLFGYICLRLSRKYKKDLFGLWWFLITLLPVINIIPIYHIIAERYLYFPFVGFSISFSALFIYIYRNNIDFLSDRFRRKGVITTLAIILSFYIVRTSIRNNDWKNNIKLWSNTVVVAPNSARAHINLGFAYQNIGDLNYAINEYKEATRLRPQNPFSHNLLGNVYLKQSRLDDGIKEYKEAIRYNPGYFTAYNNLGRAYASNKQWRNAIKFYKKAVKLGANNVNVQHTLLSGLASAYAHIKNWKEAISVIQKAIKINPNSPDAHYNLGLAYARTGRLQEAIIEWKLTLSIDPQHESAKKSHEAVKKYIEKSN